MIYKIEFRKDAQKFINKQPKNQRIRILKAIYNLPIGDVKKLNALDNTYRLRIGDFRVIFTMCNRTLFIEILKIDNRGQVYKR